MTKYAQLLDTVFKKEYNIKSLSKKIIIKNYYLNMYFISLLIKLESSGG